jgi:hypothetical protein
MLIDGTNSQVQGGVLHRWHSSIYLRYVRLSPKPFREDLGGAEQQAMHGRLGRLFGKYTEEMFFEGDQSALNPMRYIPTPSTPSWPRNGQLSRNTFSRKPSAPACAGGTGPFMTSWLRTSVAPSPA